MIDGTYDVALDTPRFHKRGLFSLEAAADVARGELVIREEEPLAFEGPLEGNDFTFEGTARFPGTGLVAYEAKGNVWGNSVTVRFSTDEGDMELFGTRLSTQAGDFKSSHDYMMAGAQGEFGSDDNTMYSGLFGDGG